MLGAVVGAVSTTNRWLLAFSLVAAMVLVGGTFFRRRARNGASQHGESNGERRAQRAGRGFRRRGGVLLALGPIVGLVFAPSPDAETIVLVVGAAALAGLGAAIERNSRADRISFAATVVAAGAITLAGARFGPTGAPVLDVVFAFLFVLLVVQAVDGLGNVDGLVSGISAFAASGIFAIAAFGAQDDLATVMLGLTAASFAFLAFNLPPASLFAGRGGRLSVGFALGAGALVLNPVPGPGRSVLTPLILLGVVLLDAVVVAFDRLRRRRSLTEHRADHMVHRLAALGWTPTESMVLLIAVQLLLSIVALFTARAVVPVWFGGTIAAAVLLFLAAEVGRGKLEQTRPVGMRRGVWIGILVVVLLGVVSVIPTAVAATGSADLMLDGRDAASRGLSAARDGDTITAGAAFNEAAHDFSRARDKLESPLLSGSLAIPGVASNVRAARALASIGTDLARTGYAVSTAVDPDALEIVDGRLPVAEVVKITPVLEEGSTALNNALRKLDDVRNDPYLAEPIEDAIDKIHAQLAQAAREATHAAAAAKLAPALFGADGPRRYLLVVQNNAESRATGGFIGSFGIITAADGKLTLGDIERTAVWNSAVRGLADAAYDAPADYRNRYAQFRPDTTLQNVNLSPDFPSVARVLMSLAPQAGQGEVDGVLAVDPAGLASLLSLTGPVIVEQWPDEITEDNVVQVTLRDAYAAYPDRTTERADFLGDVAHEAVDAATNGELGRPAAIAQALGGAAHGGHIVLAFSRPDEQRLAEQLDVASEMRPVQSDAIAVTTSNFAANKIDYYLNRSIDYHVKLRPETNTDDAPVHASLSVTLDNTAPATGLPQEVIGPFDDRFVAGVNRVFMSTYSPLAFTGAKWNGVETPTSPGVEAGRNVVASIRDLPAQSSATFGAEFDGTVKLHDGWYTLEVRHQPTLNADQVRIAVDVPMGWKIDAAPRMERPFAQRATKTVDLDRTIRFRVHITPDPEAWDLWGRLEAGT